MLSTLIHWISRILLILLKAQIPAIVIWHLNGLVKPQFRWNQVVLQNQIFMHHNGSSYYPNVDTLFAVGKKPIYLKRSWTLIVMLQMKVKDLSL